MQGIYSQPFFLSTLLFFAIKTKRNSFEFLL